MEKYAGEYNELGTHFHHGEAAEFIQHMEEASLISERANKKMSNVKSSIIGIAVGLLMIGALFMVGICFAGRICVRGCMKREISSNKSPISEVSSFTYEDSRV